MGFTNNSETSTVTEFVLLGFSGCQELQRFLFALFFGIYIFTIMGNGIIVCAVRLDQRLHTPMYILLGNFAFLEIWYITSTAYVLCIMAYDRYLAICRPLHYPTVMTQRFCCILMSLCWVFGFLSYSVSIVQLSQLPFCGPNTIDHFVCDMDPLMALSCAPAPVIEIVFYILSSLIIILTLLSVIIFGPFISILASYTLVLRAVLCVASGAGRTKAFSTCESCFMVVSLFYGTLMVM
ncbi:hypothetical protein HPG69_002051 [Diceros bicornis minor]|uniref:G-protein coupled receptors family 1 profile domain-containing protein n=1 Tax=Diceros bicornis minor TaxID=77932 RepID=A0A7J7FD01_DICBM|nr:hypothetical protein HPG69_002051 [Diceros bicornis minor]